MIEALPADTLVRARLETGRTHQIRVHFAAIGHPVAGDPEYGTAGRHGLERQFLHARRLALRHPADGRELSFESPLPRDLADALERAALSAAEPGYHHAPNAIRPSSQGAGALLGPRPGFPDAAVRHPGARPHTSPLDE